jgi:chromosome segregation ATPase
MGRIGIEYKDVVGAIHTLQGLNKSISIDNILATLGRGSRNTIGAHLKTWRSEHDLDMKPSGKAPMELYALLDGLWQRVDLLAKEQVNQYQIDAEERIQAAEQRFITSEKTQAQQNIQIHTLEENCSQAQAIIQSLQVELQSERLDKTQWQEKATGLENQVAKQTSDNVRLHDLLQKVQTNLEHYQASHQKLKTEQAMVIDKERQQTAMKLRALEEQLNSEMQQKMTIEMQFQQTQQALIKTEHEVLIFKKNHDTVLEQFNQVQVSHQVLQQQHQIETQQYALQEKELKDQLKLVRQLEAESAGFKNHVSHLEQMMQKAEDKIQALRDEKMFLTQEKAELAWQVKQIQNT